MSVFQLPERNSTVSYKKPSRKTTTKAIFCLFGNLRREMTGMGNASTAKSSTIFTAVTLNQYVLVLRHFPDIIGRQTFLTGLQKKMEAPTPHPTDGMRATNRSHVSRRIVRVGKMRRYCVRIEALVTWMRTT
jgi:hypothetical protein